MQNLNDKSWYRLLKVIFIIAFIVSQLSALSFSIAQKPVYKCDNGKIIPLSHNSTLTDSWNYRVDKECDPTITTPTFDKNGNFKEEWMHSYASNYHLIYVTDYLNSIWLIPLTFLAISFWFWIISRIFFYVVAKDKFLSGRLVDMLKRTFYQKSFKVKR